MRVEEAEEEQKVVHKVESAVERTLKATTGSEQPLDASTVTEVVKKYGQAASAVFLKYGASMSEFDQSDMLEQQLGEIELSVELTDEQLQRAQLEAMIAYAQAMRHEEDPFEPTPEMLEKSIQSFNEEMKAIRAKCASSM
jgi:hypothetical protein